MADGLNITGLAETKRMIEQVPQDLEAGISAGLVAAGTVIQGTLAANAPRNKGPYPSEFPPLDQSLITDIEVDAKDVSVASTGFGAAGPVALWNEYGHRIVSHTKKDSGKLTPPNPFMRRSTDQSAEEAIDAFCASLTDSFNSK